ncbi:MAG: lamin tail domain-containing protein [Candidatus Sumerlaeia bacterium]|nr:lamin tail domain-containing protein [Candidatus Sumerlaeia bacterium]
MKSFLFSEFARLCLAAGLLLPAFGAAQSVSLNFSNINFGVVDAGNAPFRNSSVTLSPSASVQITNVTFSGNNAGEFSLISPVIPSTLTGDTTLVLQWNPPTNNGVGRLVTAQIFTTGSPSPVTVSLQGTPREPVQFEQTINLSNWVVRQNNSLVNYTIPSGTILRPQQVLVIARNSTKSAFEAFWKTTLSSNVIYLNAGTSGVTFPDINGGETYQIFNAQGSQIDPLEFGELPEDGLLSSNRAKRVLVNATVFQLFNASTATPGNAELTPQFLDQLVLSEVSDALGGGNFIYEFVEIYYDSAPGEQEPGPPTLWMFR